MSILAKHIAFVNDQISVQAKLAERYAKQEWRQLKHLQVAENLKSLAADLESADAALNEAEATSKERIGPRTPMLSLRQDELEGLPQELLDELSSDAVADKADSAVLRVLEERGGVATLDQLLVGVFRQTGEVVKRTTMTSRLYRMGQKGIVFAIPGRKGIYASYKMNEEDASKLLGEDGQDLF